MNYDIVNKWTHEFCFQSLCFLLNAHAGVWKYGTYALLRSPQTTKAKDFKIDIIFLVYELSNLNSGPSVRFSQWTNVAIPTKIPLTQMGRFQRNEIAISKFLLSMTMPMTF